MTDISSKSRVEHIDIWSPDWSVISVTRSPVPGLPSEPDGILPGNWEPKDTVLRGDAGPSWPVYHTVPAVGCRVRDFWDLVAGVGFFFLLGAGHERAI
jgi:hypothetical protein